MSKRRKPNNMEVRYQRHARAVVKNVLAVFVTGHTGKVECVNYRTKKPIRVSPLLAQVISDVPFQWSVHICAICIDSQGKYYVKGDTHVMAVRYKQKSLVEYLNQEHQEYLLKNINKDHLYAAAWIAAPSDIPMDNEMALEIFTNLGALE